jgi:hypothetical protein
MTKIQSWAIASVGAVALVVGGLLGTGALTSAQTPTPSTATATPAASAPATSNEDATHEASESAEREAQEDSDQFAPGGKFTPNGDAAHEASESAEWEAQEDAGQVPTTTNSSATTATLTPPITSRYSKASCALSSRTKLRILSLINQTTWTILVFLLFGLLAVYAFRPAPGRSGMPASPGPGDGSCASLFGGSFPSVPTSFQPFDRLSAR